MSDVPSDTPPPEDQQLPEQGEFVTLRESLGANIRRLRAERGWTQEVLAEAMEQLGFDWSRVTVAQSENEPSTAGRSRRVTIEELIGLARALRTTAVELLSPGHIVIGSDSYSRDDLILHFVGGPLTFAPEELTLQIRLALADEEIKRLGNERKDLNKQIAKVRAAHKEDQ